jgi:hypothetical protein
MAGCFSEREEDTGSTTSANKNAFDKTEGVFTGRRN